MSSKLTLLIDADVLRYQMAFSSTSKVVWDDGDDAIEVFRPEQAKAKCEEWIDGMVDKFGADDFVMALSCKKHNFRKDVYPLYKDNRTLKPKPALWYVLDSFIYETFGDKIVERYELEGDDILGLLASHPSPKRAPGKRIVVSIDKDLATVPCRLYNPGKPDMGVRQIGRHDADLFWMKQVLTGDTVDNYPGIKGVGHKRADAVLMPVHEAHREACVEEHLGALWTAVVSTYESKGLTEADALVQARCARILRHGDYDHRKKEVRLWQP